MGRAPLRAAPLDADDPESGTRVPRLLRGRHTGQAGKDEAVTNAPPHQPQGHAGDDVAWVVARRDGVIVAADARFATLIGAPDAAALTARSWPSLVTARSGDALDEARRALAADTSWSGRLELLFADRPVELHVDLLFAEDDVVLLRARRYEPPPAATPARAADDDQRALVDTREAVRTGDVRAAARAVLQAASGAVSFSWAGVLLLAGDAVEVLAAYPSPMAGIEIGGRWSPPDAAERDLMASGEPSLDGDLVDVPGDGSPLARLAAFGMRSALRVPLYAGGQVAGAVVLYAPGRAAFSVADGVQVERLVRPLGERLDVPPARAAGEFERPATPETTTVEPSPAVEPSPVIVTPVAAEPSEAPPAVAGPEDERLEALSDLVSGVAHELNNPLTAILGYAQMLPALTGADRDQALTTIEQEALRASRIVRNLLSFARQHRPHITPVDVNAVLLRVVALRRYSLSVEDVEVAMELGELPQIDADEYQLEQVFLHLLNNAHQAMQPDGGTVTIGTELVAGHVRVTMSDNGPGVPPELAHRIFEPFFTTREVGRGSGMGLAIVYGTVTDHGGRVWVEQPPAGGARFVVELPVAGVRDAAVVEGPTTGQTAAADGRGERVLVVDDEASIRALTREILNASGYDTMTAGSGEEALRLLERQPLDLIVADVRMPGMDGVELYARIGERWPAMQRRMLFITGDMAGERTVQLLQESHVPYLEKPFQMGELLHAVRAVLDTS